jgi:hypothetical protein
VIATVAAIVATAAAREPERDGRRAGGEQP